jgi:Ca2+/H+ antiporter, TMEM165/GDT1 family
MINMNKQFIRHRVRSRVGKIIGFVILGIIGVFVFGSVIMLLWNALMPDIFNLRTITFWQALGLLVLTKILFSGFRGGPRGFGSRWKKDALRERWTNMTPEQQEKFKQEWGRRCGKPFPPDGRFDRAETPNRPADSAESK